MIDGKMELERYEQLLLEAEKRKNIADIINAKSNLGMMLSSIGRFDEALANLVEAGELAKQQDDDDTLTSLLGKQGVILFDSGDYVKAQERFLMVLDLAEKTENNGYRCDALGNLGLILASTGDLKGGMEKLNAAISIARQMEDHKRELTQLGNLGHTYLQVANVETAIKIYTLAVQLAQKIGDQPTEAGYLNNLGVIYNNISNYDLLIKTFEQVLAISEELKDNKLTFNALYHLAKGQLDKGNNELVIQYAQQALEILKGMENPLDQTSIKDLLIAGLLKAEDYSKAIDEIQTELEHSYKNKAKRRELLLLGQLTDAYFQNGDLAQSINTCKEALNLSSYLQDKFMEGQLSGRMGAIYADMGEVELSNQYIYTSIGFAETEKDFQTLAEQYYLLALNFQQVGNIQEAMEVCQKSISLFSNIGFTKQADHAKNLLIEIQSALTK